MEQLQYSWINFELYFCQCLSAKISNGMVIQEESVQEGRLFCTNQVNPEDQFFGFYIIRNEKLKGKEKK